MCWNVTLPGGAAVRFIESHIQWIEQDIRTLLGEIVQLRANVSDANLAGSIRALRTQEIAEKTEHVEQLHDIIDRYRLLKRQGGTRTKRSSGPR
jgi:hypothetical protein